MGQVGRLQRVPLREVWRHEAADFSAWMENNLDVLNEVLDFNLISAEREKAAGAFSVDLVGEDEDGRTVVIENQLEKSDHDHLGKLLTYLAALEAHAAIWIVARPRQEHANAVAWLNTASATPFYLIQVEAVRIGQSAPAPLFTVIVGPSAEAQAAGATRRELSERQQVRRRFWTMLIERARAHTELYAQRSPTADNWIAAGSGFVGLEWVFTVRQHEMQVCLYIDRQDQDLNFAIFDMIHADKDAIEAKFGDALDWQRLDAKRACRIRFVLQGGGWRDEQNWPDITDRSVKAMLRLVSALESYVPRARTVCAQRSSS